MSSNKVASLIKRINNFFKKNDLFKYIIFRIGNYRITLSKEEKDLFLIHFARHEGFMKYLTNEFEEEINNQLNQFSYIKEPEYLLEYQESCFVEPHYGWLINEKNVAFRWSLPKSIHEHTPLPHYVYYQRKNKRFFSEGLPLFYNWFNYWHFYNDIIGSLMVLDKLEFDKSIPIIAPARALQIQYVKDFLNTDYAKRWNWCFVSDSDFIHLRKAFIVKGYANVKDQFLLAKEIFISQERTGDRKIFLDRLPGGNGRVLQNKEEIVSVVNEFGYEVVTTEGMNIYDQKALFETVSVILGIHGAGLTNMLFRYPNRCKILEIFPKGTYPIHYYWLAKELGFDYDAISGASNENGLFKVDKNKLIKFLSKH